MRASRNNFLSEMSRISNCHMKPPVSSKLINPQKVNDKFILFVTSSEASAYVANAQTISFGNVNS